MIVEYIKGLPRFKITRPARQKEYIIMDRKKLGTCIPDKRYTHKTFRSVEMAKGFLFGMGKGPVVLQGINRDGVIKNITVGNTGNKILIRN